MDRVAKRLPGFYFSLLTVETVLPDAGFDSAEEALLSEPVDDEEDEEESDAVEAEVSGFDSALCESSLCESVFCESPL